MITKPVSRAHLSFLALAGVAVIFALPLAWTESSSQTAAPPAQKAGTEPPTAQEASLKVEAPSVIADVIVTDKKGRHVSGLAAEDFRVYEDEAPQKILTFVPPVIEAAPPTEEPPLPTSSRFTLVSSTFPSIPPPAGRSYGYRSPSSPARKRR
jgi:hypothetical protein